MPRETVAQARARMRREGWSEKQIQGQVNRWHRENAARPPLSSGLNLAAPGHVVNAPPPPPRSGGRDAAIWAAKHSPSVAVNLLVPTRKPPRQAVAPYRRGKEPTTPPPSRQQQYRWAQQAQVRSEAARKLAKTITPREKREILDPTYDYRQQLAAHPRLPQLPWYERFNPVVRAGAIVDPLIGLAGQGTAAAGRGIGHYAGNVAQGLVADLLSGAPPSTSLRGSGGWRTTTPVATGAVLPVTPEQAGHAVVTGALGAGKMLAAGGFAAQSLATDPLHAFPKTVEGGIQSLRGLGQVGGLVMLAADPRTPAADRAQMWKDVSRGFIDYYVQNYGPDASLADVRKHGQDDPFNALADAITVVAPASRIASVGRLMLRGKTLTEAIKLSYHPAEARELLLHVEGGGTRRVEKTWSKHPLVRTTVNRPYDLLSHLADRAPMLRRLPIAEHKRAARLLDAQNRRTLRRLPAAARSVFRDVEEVVKDNPEYATTLATLMQKPQGFTDDEWLRAVVTDLREMLDGRSFISPQKESPGIKRLRNRVRVLEAASDSARVRRRARASGNIVNEQERLANSLDDINDWRKDALQEMADLERQPDLSDEEKAAQRADLQAELRALNTQARVAREELDGLAVEQEPVEHPARTELREKAIENGAEPQHIDDALAALDARARVWAGQTGRDPSEWYAGLETRLVSEGEIPSVGVLHQRGGESHIPRVVYSEKKIAARQKSKLKPRKGTATGKPTTRTLWAETDDGKRFKLAGNITPKDWVQRVLAVIPTAEGRDSFARWYEHYAPMFRKEFGKDANRVMRGFAVSQANASPSSGLGAVLKVIDILDAGGEVGPNEISVVGEAIAKAVKDEEIDKFVAAKLSDFIDALAGRDTRTWMGHAPEAGSPAPTDVHAIRDRGFIDKKLVRRLTGRGYKQGKDFKVEGLGAATGPLYERIGEWYHEIVDHLNEINFDGRNDWTPAQAQALGWSAIQIAHKVIPEGFAEAFASNTRKITFEVTRGPLGLGNDLTPAQTRRVANSMKSAVRELVKDTPGLWLRDVQIGVGGWEQGTNINISVRVLGSRDSVQQALTRFAKAFDQEWVQATREVTGKNSRATLLIDSPKFRDPRTRARFFQALNRIEPRLEGFMDYDVDGVPGLAIRTNSPSVSPKNADKFVNRYRAAIEKAEAETGIEVNGSVRNMEMLTGGQHGEVAPIQTLAGSGGGLHRDTLDDPLAARIRDELTAGINRERGTAEGAPERGVVRAQTRQGDLLGAVQFLDSDAGKRILYLTPDANPSTILHELVGHATDEMHSLYPEEFGAVETEVGRPYADWTVEDHEKFARWAERYFHEGYAPTPELVVPMARIKAWMRSIYAGMTQLLGKRLPVATRTLFDSYFGAYDDENVARIAVNMGREGWGREDLAIQRPGGAEALERARLTSLRRSIETRSYNRSLDGVTNRLQELEDKVMDEPWTPEEFDEYQQLSAEKLTREAANMVKADKREKALRSKLEDLEKAMAGGVDHPAFQGALESLKWISEDRERVLRETFGDRYDEMFANRRDLLADWLVDRGLLKPTFVRGTAYYFPMTMEEPLARGLASGASPVVSRVLGKTKTDLLKLHKRNQMIAWQNGSWQADPAVVLEAHQRAQSYAYVNQIKNMLYELGRPITRAEAENLPGNVYLVNPTGTPLGPELKAAIRSKTSTLDLHRLFDGNEGGDNRELEASLKKYIDSFLIDPKALPDGFDPLVVPNLRVIPSDVVSLLMRPVRPQVNKAGKTLDVATTMSRWALIYGNVPGYMITNGIGNVFFLLAQQGIKAPLMLKGMKILLEDRKLWDKVMGEIGELPMQAAIQRGRNFSDQPGHVMQFESYVDRVPRAAAWVYEARKLGYTSAQDMHNLIEGKGTKLVRDRERVADLANEYMVNFDRLGYWEKQNITRFLFVWPWVRGATAWPFWYAKMHPERAAIAAQVGSQLDARRRRILGPTPDYYANLTPGPRHGTHARVVNAGPIGLTSTAAEKLQFMDGLLGWMLHRKPDENTHGLIALASPFVQDLVELATGRDDFGRQVSFMDTLSNSVVGDTIPFWRLGKALYSDDATPRPFQSNTGLESRAARNFLRITPQQVSIRWMNYSAQKRGEKSMDEKIAEGSKQARKAWAKIAPGEPFSQELLTIVKREQIYEQKQKDLVQQKTNRPTFEPQMSESGLLSGKATLSNFEKAQIAYAVLQRYPTSGSNDLPSPEAVLREAQATPTSVLGDLVMKRYLSAFDKFNSLLTRTKSGAKKTVTAKKLVAELEKEGR